jgi:hypothetical protein
VPGRHYILQIRPQKNWGDIRAPTLSRRQSIPRLAPPMIWEQIRVFGLTRVNSGALASSTTTAVANRLRAPSNAIAASPLKGCFKTGFRLGGSLALPGFETGSYENGPQRLPICHPLRAKSPFHSENAGMNCNRSISTRCFTHDQAPREPILWTARFLSSNHCDNFFATAV